MHRHVQPARGDAADAEALGCAARRTPPHLARRGRVRAAEGGVAEPVGIKRAARRRPGPGVCGRRGCVAHPEQHLEVNCAGRTCGADQPPGPGKAGYRARRRPGPPRPCRWASPTPAPLAPAPGPWPGPYQQPARIPRDRDDQLSASLTLRARIRRPRALPLLPLPEADTARPASYQLWWRAMRPAPGTACCTAP